ncbi:MAG: 4'-phosphopantetheinyl transferase superfamily protein [Bacteroidota bacterium]
MPGSVNCSFIGQPGWGQLPASEGLNKYTIYIWRGATANLHPLYYACFALLDPQERARALRYHQLQDKQRYVIQHGILRVLLGSYLNVPAQDITFTYNQNKKPGLTVTAKPCFFNISHSAGEFLIAIGDTELGVDIERINPDFAYADIASNYFSADEVVFINGSHNPTEAFFLLWTRKEALLKACGTGIDDNLPAMPGLDGPRELPADYPDTNWLTESFYTGNDFMGSITYPSPQKKIVFRQIDADWIAPLF